MIWFNAKFRVANAGGCLDTKPKLYQDLLIEAMAALLTKIRDIGPGEREDLLEMMRTIEVSPGKSENKKRRGGR